MASSHNHFLPDTGAREFHTTHWSTVLLAGDSQSPESAQALEKLCAKYWYPLYAFIRRKGYGRDEAKDLTQGFFGQLLAKKYLASVAPSKGLFRTFLLCSLDNFLANEWDRSQRQKRGGGCTIISFDDDSAEDRYQLEPVELNTPEKIYERRWAQTAVELVLRRLREEFRSEGKDKRFEELKGYLLGDESAAPYAETAPRLGLTVAGLKSAVHQLRKRFRAMFREEIAHTVSSPGEVEDEIRHLLLALSN